MNLPSWARVRAIFEDVVERDVAERESVLDAACAGDAALRAEVDSLLRAHETSGGFLESPAYEAVPDLLVDEPAPLDEGRRIGPYVIRHELGRGGMGVVYLADDTRLGRQVALKALPPGIAHEPTRRERLRREARTAAALSHPGIATVYALEEVEDELYLATEYVPGPTLRAVLAGGPLPATRLIDVALQLASAMEAAHARGIVHRDLKPENIVFTPGGAVKVLDFGIALDDRSGEPRLTGEAEWLGTPAYAAPEQLRNDPVAPWADQYSFGVCLYELATGRNPFEADTRTASIARVLEVEPPPLTSVNPELPARLSAIVARCLSKHHGGRYALTSDLVAELAFLQADLRGVPLILPSTPVAPPAPVAPEPLVAPTPAPQDQTGPQPDSTPLWWWRFHQIAVSTVYVLVMYPVWVARHWLPAPWNLALLFAALACTAGAATLRLHLWFTATRYPAELAGARRRARGPVRACDLGLSVALLGGALALGEAHQATAVLLLATAVAALVASLVVEPTTERAAFTASA